MPGGSAGKIAAARAHPAHNHSSPRPHPLPAVRAASAAVPTANPSRPTVTSQPYGRLTYLLIVSSTGS
ncbi:hypothetical protein HDA43_006642 [Streptosporangium sandarakinum]|uniref:Uncharacterized protein n=1 Tax=Streptosporangium sandarakinum TaxID=1260955 RepID=A0A852VE19_9ACTN|nr:hypothetical protein [Streptosporangium sandarakinum]NYF44415.1 hypothetical protein [Streptosporangium sandarakinum]